MKAPFTATFALALAACTTLPTGEPQQALHEMLEQRADAQLAWHRDPDVLAAAESEVAARLAEPLTREAAVRIALLNNRDVQARFAALDIAAADWFNAVRIPNPVLHVEALWPAGGGGPSWDLGLTQSLMALLTRSARRAGADLELEAMGQEAAAAVLGLMRDVEWQFVRTQAAAEARAVMQQAVSVTEAAAVAAGALYEAGNVPRLRLVQERQLHAQTRLALSRAESRHRSEREALNRLLGLWGEQTDWTLEARLPPLPESVDVEADVERDAVVASLELAALQARLEAAGIEAGLADATALLPALDLGAAAERDAGGPWERGPRLALELPLSDRGQGRRAQAHARVELLAHRWWQAAAELRSHAREALWHQHNAHQQALHVDRVLLPQAGELLQLTLLDHNAMEADAFDLLNARRAQLDTGLASVDARRDYWLAQVAVRHLLRGGPPSRLPDYSDTPTGAGPAGGH